MGQPRGFVVFLILGLVIEPKALDMLNIHFINELHPQPNPSFHSWKQPEQNAQMILGNCVWEAIAKQHSPQI